MGGVIVGQVVVELWDDQGFLSAEEKVLVMATVPATNLKYDWIPAKHAGLLPSDGYKVRVHWDLNANVYDDSGDFEIYHDGTNPSLHILPVCCCPCVSSSKCHEVCMGQ